MSLGLTGYTAKQPQWPAEMRYGIMREYPVIVTAECGAPARRYLPPGIVDRKKHGFAVLIGALIRTLFRERCCDVLLSSANPVADWFERDALEGLLDEHLAGRHDHGKKLWALYILFAVAERRPTPHSPAAAVLTVAR